MLWRNHFGWGKLGVGVFVMVHDKTGPADRDWEDCMKDLEEFAAGRTPSAIVFTDGGAPKGAQRAELNKLVGKSPPTAVVSDALVTRFVVSSFALMNPSIACFASHEINEAWHHLGLSDARTSLATADLIRQARSVDVAFRTVRAALRIPALVHN
jgi:hypothetical protein